MLSTRKLIRLIGGITMKCRKQPKFLEKRPVKIANVLEVHLSLRQWARIIALAASRKKTFSTMTRYCVLRLARKEHLRWTPVLRKTREKLKEEMQNVGKVHRHVMCLYGEDEMLVRLASMRLRITMSAFIRLALDLFLERLAMEKQGYSAITDENLKWQAIRFIENYTPHTQNLFSRPHTHRFKWRNFAVCTYW
ncbi:MAG: hypothetical protein LDLANPLL_00428 [Turneriella sp.]|nr:hypothetical protein [Turneriella sp.]